MVDIETTAAEFELAIACEKLAAAVYREFMKKFSHVPEIAEFWNDMVKDEEEHAKLLEEVYKSLTPDQLNAQADSRLLLELGKILKLRLDDLTEPVKTLNDAYNIAVELEDSEVNPAFRLLVKEFVSSKERCEKFMHIVEGHLKRLMDFSQNYGDSSWRKSITAK